MQNAGTRRYGLDHWFFHLVWWELRLFRGRRRNALRLVACLAAAAAAAVIWHTADAPAQWTTSGSNGDSVRSLALALLGATPPQDRVANVAQWTMGYYLLRFGAYTAVAFAKLLLPALATGSVVGDRQAGRLIDLEMLPVRPAALFFAKASAAALPFLALSLALDLLFGSAAVLEYVPIGEAARLCAESAVQIATTAIAIVACSAIVRTAAGAGVLAPVVVWLLLPTLWLAILLATSAIEPLEIFRIAVPNWNELTHAPAAPFEVVCASQAGYTVAAAVTLSGIGDFSMRRARSGYRRSTAGRNAPGRVKSAAGPA